MSIIITNSRVVGNADDGSLIKYVEGFCDSDDESNLPKTNIADGSNFIASDTGDWYFYNEGDNAYSALTNVGG